MATIDLSRGWRIVSPSVDPVAACAATELAETLARIAGGPVPVDDEALSGVPNFNLSHGEGEADGFTWQATPEQVILRGDNPRGLLYAVYSFLEALGCRWVARRQSSGRRASCSGAVPTYAAYVRDLTRQRENS